MKAATTVLLSFLPILAVLGQKIPTSPNQRNAQGQRLGAWVILYDQYDDETTQPDSMVYYRTITFGADGIATGPVDDTYRSGKPRFSGRVLAVDPKVIYHENCVWYHTNGQKARQGRFYYGIADSLYREWDSRGRLLFDATYRRSVKDGFRATIRTDVPGAAFTAALYPPMPPQQTCREYISQHIAPVVAQIGRENAQIGATDMLGILWANEQKCRTCVQRYSSKGSICARAFKQLADSYSALGYEQASTYFQRAIDLSQSFFAPYPATESDSPYEFRLPNEANEYHSYFLNYAVHCIRYRQFAKATSLLNQLVTTARAPDRFKEAQKINQYDLLNCLNLLLAAGADSTAVRLMNDQEQQLNAHDDTYGTDLCHFQVGGMQGHAEVRRELRDAFSKLRFQLRAKRGDTYTGNLLNTIQEGEPNLLIAIGDAQLRARQYNQAEQTYLRLAEQMNHNYANSSWQRQITQLKEVYWPLVLKRLIDLYEQTGQSAKAQPLALELQKVYPAHLTQVKSFYLIDFRPTQISKSDDEITQRAIENEGPATFNFTLAHKDNYPFLATYAYDNALMLKTLSYASLYNIATQPLSETVLLDARTRDVRRALQPDEAAIEFVSFRQYTNRWTDSTLYAALVLRPGESQPHMVRLCTGNQLQALTRNYRAAPERGINQAYNPRGAKVQGAADTLSGDKLYRLIWQPIADLLKGVKTIYVAPSGELNKVAFAAFPINSQAVLADSFRIRQVVCTSSIIRRSDLFLTKTDSVALFGAIRYDVDSLQLTKLPKTSTLALPRLPITAQQRIKPLPGTARELAILQALFTNARSYTGLNATESQLSKQAPKVLHFATHGFYFPLVNPLYREADRYQDPTAKALTSYGNFYAPLLRSGLLMAGAQHVWRGGQPIRGIDDGILSAFEIATLKLPNTRLIVLSACETALGDVRGNEAVLGFQRAFKMIGVQTLLVSLWQVPDTETAEFMQHFYGNCLNARLSVSESFYKTQQFMRKKYPREPYKWAAFTLIE